MTTFLQDLRFAARQLRKTPGFTLTALLTLALGIGANAAIFTLVNAVLQRNLPVGDPKTLIRLGDNNACCVGGGYGPSGAIIKTLSSRPKHRGFSRCAVEGSPHSSRTPQGPRVALSL
jgi:hypothetical protein